MLEEAVEGGDDVIHEFTTVSSFTDSCRLFKWEVRAAKVNLRARVLLTW
jgi:hypothetical protein